MQTQPPEQMPHPLLEGTLGQWLTSPQDHLDCRLDRPHPSRSVRVGLAPALGLLCLICGSTPRLSAAPAEQSDSIHSLISRLHEEGRFNGSIIVAQNGAVVYRDALGAAPDKRNGRFSPTTSSNVASISKQFTAMAVMILAEHGKLRIDDGVRKYLPELGHWADGITIRHLLTHTSGIPDVGDLSIDHPKLREDEMLRAINQQRRDFAPPGAKYRYSNTGYMLLAMTVERISSRSLGEFLRDVIFQPLGMDNTWLSSPVSSAGYTKGDGGIWSNVDDLFKWDQALYNEKLVQASALAEAFTPAMVTDGNSTYGFGWNILEQDGEKYVWHSGSTDNYRAFIGRRLGRKQTVIILTNGDSPRREIGDAIFNILNGKPYHIPKFPINIRMREAVKVKGIDAALGMYISLKAADAGVYDFSESELNSLGYELLSQGETTAATKVFELNATEYPASSNAFDSLGDAYQQSGKPAQAIKAFREAIRLDPGNLDAVKKLRALQ